MPREKTPEQKLAWAAYMRRYRTRQTGQGPGAKDPRGTKPTPRQLQVLRAYADPEHGGSQKAVAEYLNISVSAVNNTLQRLAKRLGVKDPAQAVWLLRDELTEVANGTSQAISAPERRGTQTVR